MQNLETLFAIRDAHAFLLHNYVNLSEKNSCILLVSTPFAVYLRKIYINLCQQLKLYGKFTFISTSMNFINANELSITLFAYVLTFNSVNGWTIAPLDNQR